MGLIQTEATDLIFSQTSIPALERPSLQFSGDCRYFEVWRSVGVIPRIFILTLCIYQWSGRLGPTESVSCTHQMKVWMSSRIVLDAEKKKKASCIYR